MLRGRARTIRSYGSKSTPIRPDKVLNFKGRQKSKMAESIEAAAQALLRGRTGREPFQSVAETHAISGMTGAYDVQERFVELLQAEGGGAIAGYKIALTSKAMQEMCGVDRPLAGAILDGVVHRSPAAVPLSAYRHLGLEFETAVILGADMPDRGKPYTREEVSGFVSACAPAFELIEDRNADYAALDAVGITADNAWNGGVVLGEPVTGWREIDLTAAPVCLAWANEAPAAASTGEAMGHPFEAVAWVANHLNVRGQALKAGQLVMTGSTMKTRFPAGGEEIVYTIEGLGTVSLTIA